jgi:transposase
LHALCNAHYLRELQAFVEIENEDRAHKMRCLSRRASHRANLARDQDVPRSPGLITLIERCYEAILANGFTFREAQPILIRMTGKRLGRKPHRVGHNLPPRLSTCQEDVLRFLSDPVVAFANNLDERDGLIIKPCQRISGALGSKDLATNFGVIRSPLSTPRTQGWDVPTTLAVNPNRPDNGATGGVIAGPNWASYQPLYDGQRC